ncbi:MAG: Cys-tRNA(Pro) deacylase [Clostridium sp.]|nr:Cys-tRNA(Pro) deacylase [Clostridium sp.]
MAKSIKTNAMRILDREKVDYSVKTYDTSDGKIDGVSVAKKVNEDEKYVYKTLVAVGHSREIYVFVLPVADELDLKKAASTAGEKSIQMLHVKDLQKNTGYIRGGCSPIGMKKQYKTFISDTAEDLDKMIVSGGKIGTQIIINPGILKDIIEAKMSDIIQK